MTGFNIGHAGSVKLNHIGTVGNERYGSGNGLLIDEGLHPLRDLGKNFLVDTSGFGV
jgi:hypothetical protein